MAEGRAEGLPEVSDVEAPKRAVDRIRDDAVFWLGQMFPQDVSKVAGDFFDYVVASLKTLSPSDLAEMFGARPCADGTYVHDFKGQQSCPACGMEGIRV